MSTDALVQQVLPRATELRHQFHQIPELAFEEHKTAALIRQELDRLNITCIPGVPGAETATIALLGPRTADTCIALRADMDALPIIENTNLPYASNHPGKMHACGHDGHTATLLAVAAILKSLEQKNKLTMAVRLLFQPAEEGGGGADKLVQAGALDQSKNLGPKPTAIFGLHGWPALKVGTVATKPGPLLAATDNFAATFIGKGCHGAYPHLGADPIVAAANAVINLQQIPSRDIDPTDSIVITVGIFHAGTATNIIPDTATIEATVRTLNDATRQKARNVIERRLNGIAQASNCQLNLDYIPGYPATINDPAMADYVATVARKTLGPTQFVPVQKSSMGGEDFAYYLQKIPGCFFLIGVQPQNATDYPPLHSDQYNFTDEALATGIKMFVELVLNWKSSAT